MADAELDPGIEEGIVMMIWIILIISIIWVIMVIMILCQDGKLPIHLCRRSPRSP